MKTQHTYTLNEAILALAKVDKVEPNEVKIDIEKATSSAFWSWIYVCVLAVIVVMALFAMNK